MRFQIIQSGSKGNATIVISDGRILLIDMGICLKTLTESLKSINKNIYNINAMLLTHEHSDHTKGINYLPPLPIYTLKGTYESNNIIELNLFKTTQIAGFDVTPIKTSHDVVNPCGFIIEDKGEKLVYVTDTGYLPVKTLNKIKNADYYIFESNHDVQMLMNTSRPYLLKKRILSKKGHLSNLQSALYLSGLIGPKTKEIFLAHLSEEANSPSVALETHLNIYNDSHIDLSNIKLSCANQHIAVEGGRK